MGPDLIAWVMTKKRARTGSRKLDPSEAAGYRRLICMVVLLTVGFGTLGYRLVDLQVVQHERWRKRAAVNTQSLVLREPRRGEIRDRRGTLLAGTVPVKSIAANPALIGTYQPEVARAIAPLLEIDEQTLVRKLQPRVYVAADGRTRIDKHVPLKQKVTVETWERIQQTMRELDFGIDEKALPRKDRAFFRDLRAGAIFAERHTSQARVYPNGSLAAHILGYVQVVDRKTIAGPIRELAGAEGIERVLDTILSGVPGWRSTEKVRGQELVNFREQDVQPVEGRNVVLTIDAGVQHIVESELAAVMEQHAPNSVSAVVVRPKTGEILALANMPTFDPNRLADFPEENRRNRAITDVLEPGSTFKIVPVSAGLQERLLTLDTRYDCENGRWWFAGRPLKDDHPAGVLSVQDIVKKSSNIGTAKIAIQLGPERLYEYIRRFGFGDKTGIPLSGEGIGLVYPPKKWSKLSVSRIAIGHGIAVTPIQLAMAMCAVANGGKLMRPMLVDRIEDDRGELVLKYEPQVVREVVSEATARQMVAALKTVVSPNGTARRAQLKHYTVAGKTGTAQKPEAGTYSHTKFFASFVGFFPADDPELCIAVVLDEPKGKSYYGGTTAGPAFKNIAERSARYLAIKPDLPPTAALAAAGSPGVAARRGGQP